MPKAIPKIGSAMAGLIINVLIDGLMGYPPTILSWVLKPQSPDDLFRSKTCPYEPFYGFHQLFIA
jgi:hypothetical protein